MSDSPMDVVGVGGKWRATVLTGLFTAAVMAGMLPSALAHLGGEVVRPVFLSPSPSMVMVSDVLNVSWNDPDSDPTGVLHFFLLEDRNIPPEAEPALDLLGGIEVAAVPVSDTEDVLAIDLSGLAPGVYTFHAITTDPPLCDQATPLFATLTVPDPDPDIAAPMSALWRNPKDPLTTISGLYSARLSVRSIAPPTFTMEVGRMVPLLVGDPADPCSARQRFEVVATLATDELAVADTEGGANLWTAKHVWKDAAALGSGSYVLRATLKSGDQTLTLFAPGVVEVLAAPEPSPESAELGPAADTAERGADAVAQNGAETAAETTDVVAGGAGCQSGGVPGGGGTSLWLALGAVLMGRRYRDSEGVGGLTR